MPHIRAHIRLNTMEEVRNFVQRVNGDGSVNKFMIEDFDGKQRVSARSVMGVLYAMTDFNDNMFFVNDSTEGELPSFIDEYRI